MDKTASPIIYGVLGYPVKHSFSPAMHNAAFKALNLNARYRYFQKKPQELKDFLFSLSKKQIFGINVTVPHKESVLPFMAELSEEARLIRAVNTVKVAKKALLGFNTDGAGFLKHLGDDLKFDPRGKKIALLGSGGAAKALAVYLSRVPVESIAFFDLDRPKAEGLIRQLEKIGSGVTYRVADSVEDLGIPSSDLLINATPQGMKADDPCIVKKNLLHQGLLVYDLVYNPKETKLLALARQSGVACSNGLGMLLYQGALSFEIWTGQKAPIEVMRRALTEVVYL